MTDWTPALLADAVDREGASLVAAAETDPDAAVPACPGFSETTLLKHVTRVLERTRVRLTSGSLEPTDFERSAADGTPARFRQVLGATVEELRTADPTRMVSTFVGPRPAAFWQQRMALELLVHRWDAQQGVGVPGPLDPDLAHLGIAEVAAVMLPARVSAGTVTGPVGTVRVRSTDTGGDWALQVDDRPAQASLAGPVDPLLLWLYGRLDGDALAAAGVHATGDLAVLTAWSEHVRF